jgi:hypothetical protein
MKREVPWGVELDEDEGELFKDSGKVGVSEDEDVVLDGVGCGQHDECCQQTYLDGVHH